MIFWFLTPVPPRTWVPPFFGGGGGGGQNIFAYCGRCVCIWTRVLKNSFLVYGPPNPWRGSRVPTPGTPPPPLRPLAVADLAVFSPDSVFSGTCKFFEVRFFMKPFRCP